MNNWVNRCISSLYDASSSAMADPGNSFGPGATIDGEMVDVVDNGEEVLFGNATFCAIISIGVVDESNMASLSTVAANNDRLSFVAVGDNATTVMSSTSSFFDNIIVDDDWFGALMTQHLQRRLNNL
jgi:hypothetical protein